jgi:GH43 family beta-xylosidase
VRQPLLGWERNVNEGPFFIYNRNVSYLLFAASFTFSEYYCLGLMSIDQGLDPMNASNWWYGPEDGPVFYKNDDENVFGSGHASFTTSPDYSETWMVYHAADNKERIEHYRVARAEKVEWDPVTGKPVFPRPHGYYSPIPLPSGQVSVQKTTFTNPIISGDSPDPRILLLDGTYYLTLASNGTTAIKIIASRQLTNFRNTNSKTVMRDSVNCFTEVWSPEMRLINGQLYMYFSARNCSGTQHTLYVSRAQSPTNPLGEWSQPKALLPSVQAITADGSVMVRDNDLHLVYESHETPYGLHIAKMDDPMTVNEQSRKVLLTPTEQWHSGVVNGPAFLKKGNVTYMSFSGGNPGGADYCTGIVQIEDGQDPLNAAAWKDVYGKEPVFCKNEQEAVYGPGHVGFVPSPDGTQTYITYHAAEWSDRIFGDRIARIEKLDFDQDGKPVFPKPHGYFSPQPLPSGQAY